MGILIGMGIRKFYKCGRYLLSVLTAGFIAFIFYPNFVELEKLQTEYELLERKLYILIRKNRMLKRRIALLENSPQEIEKIAREKLGWTGPNELIYKFQK